MEVLSGASAHAHNSQVCPGQPELNLKASTGESKLKEISQNGKLGLGETAETSRSVYKGFKHFAVYTKVICLWPFQETKPETEFPTEAEMTEQPQSPSRKGKFGCKSVWDDLGSWARCCASHAGAQCT